MRHLAGKVAVITGGASGLGRAMAERFAREGMRIVLADIEAPALAQAESVLKAAGAEVLAVRTDTSKAADVERLAERAYAHFGAAHIVCNNAGVANHFAPTWERSLADWEWIVGVNFWGVLHGIRAFVPRMLKAGTEGHVVNTASMAAITSGPFISDYFVTKHAVLALSESLHHELTLTGSRIRVSALCPGFVKTRIMEADRNRPTEAPAAEPRPELRLAEDGFRHLVNTSSITAEEVAGRVVDAVRAERFYILTHAEAGAVASRRLEDIVEGRNPEWRLNEILAGGGAAGGAGSA